MIGFLAVYKFFFIKSSKNCVSSIVEKQNFKNIVKETSERQAIFFLLLMCELKNSDRMLSLVFSTEFCMGI